MTDAPHRRGRPARPARPIRPEVAPLEGRLLLAGRLSLLGWFFDDATSTTLTASASRVARDTPVTLTATVRDVADPAARPTGGTVTFYDGRAPLGTAPLRDGMASLTTSALGDGIHKLTATFGGASGLMGSRSGSISGRSPIGPVAGQVGRRGVSGDGGPATEAQVGFPSYLAVDAAGNLYIADDENAVVRKVTTDGLISTVAGVARKFGATGDGGPATSAQVGRPGGVAVDAAGNLYIADVKNNVVRAVAPDGTIRTVAGRLGRDAASGDNAPATQAEIGEPEGLAVDAAGNLYVGDRANNLVRKIDPDGIIHTVAGQVGRRGVSGDGGPATEARIGEPSAVAVDAAGNLYIADYLHSIVRKVTPDGIIRTVAGRDGEYNSTGDGGPATRARLRRPAGLAVDAAGDLFIADHESDVVREVTSDGIIRTVAGRAGKRDRAATGDGATAAEARLGSPTGLAVDAAGDLYIGEASKGVVARVEGPVSLSVGPYRSTVDGAPTPQGPGRPSRPRRRPRAQRASYRSRSRAPTSGRAMPTKAIIPSR